MFGTAFPLLKVAAATALIALVTLLPAPPARAHSTALQELSPAWVTQNTTQVFSALWFNPSSTDQIQCVRAVLPSGWSLTSQSVVGSSVSANRTWSTPTIDVSARTVTWKAEGSGSSNPNRLLQHEFARMEIQATTPSSTSTAHWTLHTSTNSSCTSSTAKEIGVRVNSAPPTAYLHSADFRNATGQVIAPAIPSGTGTFRLRITQTATQDTKPIEHAVIALHSCLSSVTLQDLDSGKVRDSQNRSWTPLVRGNVVRLTRDANGLTPNQHIQVHFTADATGCPDVTQTVTTAAWENMGPSPDGSKSFANTAGGPALIANTPPGIVTLSAPAAEAAFNQPPKLQWAAATDVDGDPVTYQVQVGTDCHFTQPDVDEESLTTRELALVGLDDGEYCWRVRAHDGRAHGEWSAPRGFTLDTIDPVLTVTFPVDEIVYNAASWDEGCVVPGICGTAAPDGTPLTSVTATLSDETANDTVDVVLDNGQWTGSQLAVDLADGAYNLAVEVTDVAGNSAAEELGFVLDKAGPTVWMEGHLLNDITHVLGEVPPAPACEATDKLDPKPDCVVSGYSKTLGKHTVTATATDWAGNISTSTFTYTVVAPTPDSVPNPPDSAPNPPGPGAAPQGPSDPLPTDPTGPLTVKSAPTATVANPAAVWVTTPKHGRVEIRIFPSSRLLAGFTATVVAPAATAAEPLTLVFRTHLSALHPSTEPKDALVSRGGLHLPDCTGPGASPDPCVAGRYLEGDEVVVIVRSSTAGRFLVGFPWPPAGCAALAPTGVFGDVASEGPHTSAIECIAWLGIAHGTTGSTFAPGTPVTRGQAASFVARLVDHAGASLPAGDAGFADTAGSVHERAIGRLAAAGLVFGLSADRFAPNEQVTREQMASLLVRVHDHLAGAPLPTAGRLFNDSGGGAHESNIGKAARAGLIEGYADGRFGHKDALRRDQAASVLLRLLELVSGTQ